MSVTPIAEETIVYGNGQTRPDLKVVVVGPTKLDYPDQLIAEVSPVCDGRDVPGFDNGTSIAFALSTLTSASEHPTYVDKNKRAITLDTAFMAGPRWRFLN